MKSTEKKEKRNEKNVYRKNLIVGLTVSMLMGLMIIISILLNRGYLDSFHQNENDSGFIYEYGVFLSEDAEDMEQFKSYRILVIDAANFSKEEISVLKAEGHILYSYLNVGSIEDFRSYYDDFLNIALSPYQNWEGEFWMNVADEKWQKLILETLIPEYMNKGITNFFIDNCDVYYQYETEDTYQGLNKILMGIRKAIKDDRGKIMINGGDVYITRFLKDHKSLEPVADSVNQETVYSGIDFQKNTFYTASPENTDFFLSYLNKVKASGSDVYLLEYSKNTALINKIKDNCKKQGFTVYVADSLDL